MPLKKRETKAEVKKDITDYMRGKADSKILSMWAEVHNKKRLKQIRKDIYPLTISEAKAIVRNEMIKRGLKPRK